MADERSISLEQGNAYAVPGSLVEQQQIHIPGSIQPHGVLLTLDEPELRILQVSNNTPEYLGVEVEELLGTSLSSLLDATQLQLFRQHLPVKVGQRSWFKLSTALQHRLTQFNADLWRTTDALILELEPVSEEEDSILGTHLQLSQAITHIKQTPSLEALLAVFVDEIQGLTGFDRVHVYQFDEQGAGEVVAEARQDHLTPYLGLHFPAWDIPAQARALYALQLVRIIPDLSAPPVVIVPALHPTTQQPLDLSLATLRSVDPCCVTYHQNMGTRALLVASMMTEQKLWGLLTCHHSTAKQIPPNIRAACDLLVQLTASELESKLRQADLTQQTQVHALQSELIQSIAEADNFIDALIKPEMRLLDLVNATGAAVCLGDEITLLGQTPPLEQTRSLVEWINQEIADTPFHTNCLAKVYPGAEAFKTTASGLLFLRISKVQRYGIFWFRPEVLQTISWGGNPNDSLLIDDAGQPQLCPRHSFERWQETVCNTSLPWHSIDLRSAIDLRNAIVGIVLKKAENLANLNQELQQSNRELASFAYAAAHDLKEPLRGIYNYANIFLEDYAQVLDDEGLDYLADIQSFAQRMETLINALLRIAQLRQATLQTEPTDLNILLEKTIAVIQASRPAMPFTLRMPQSLPQLQCDATLMAEVFGNLISNAIKYNEQSEKWVEVRSERELPRTTDSGTIVPASWVFSIRDNGIGIPDNHLSDVFRLFKRLHPQELYGGGVGVGLAIVRQIIERHGGQIWVESVLGEGSTVYFTLPNR